jgi:hypothetical protein
MSILSFPRINFRGVFRTNPCTANNDDVMPAVVERDVDSLGATLSGMTDDQVHAYLREQVSMSDPGGKSCTPFIRSGWNLYGDHFTSFDDAVVASVVRGPQPADRIASPAGDPLVGQPVFLLGSVSSDPLRRGDAVLCDLDATGLVTTQLWVGGLQIGGGPDGSDPSRVVVCLDHDARGFQNWLNFASTLGTSGPGLLYGRYGGQQNFVGIGCIMQFGIPASALPAAVSFASPGLQALLAAGRAAAGLVVRFRCFEVQPGLRDESLYAAFQQGNAVDNPALGYLVGTIGVWGVAEPETEPAGRKLQCPYPRPDMSWRWDTPSPTTIPGIPVPWQGPPALVGNVVASVQQSPAVISLDLVNAFPKAGFRDPDGPETPTARGFGAPRKKADVGQLQLAVLPSGGGPAQVIAPVDYGLLDYGSYEDFGGIVDLPYDPALHPTIAAGTLVIQGAPSSPLNADVTLVRETPLRVVTDDRAVYLLPGAENAPVRVKLYQRGGRTQQDAVLFLVEYMNIIETQSGGPCQDGVRPNQTVSSQSPGILSFPSQVRIPAGQGFDDWFVIPISAARSGATILSYQLGDTVFGTSVPAWTTANYSSIRVYANSDFSALYAKGPLQWDDVYQAVLRYYYLLFPAMSRFIPLNLADSIVQRAALIKQRLNTPEQPGFYTTYNMPLTRSMSPAKVKLLLDFIEQQENASRPRSQSRVAT